MKTIAKKAKHTPGPWAIGKGGFHVYYVNPKIEAGDETINDPQHDSVIASCEPALFGCLSGISDEVAMANAKLIAAAPLLYQKLYEAHIVLIVLDPENPIHEEISNVLAKAKKG